MKFDKILMIILIFILAIGAVSASDDNMTDSLTADVDEIVGMDSDGVSEQIDDQIIEENDSYVSGSEILAAGNEDVLGDVDIDFGGDTVYIDQLPCVEITFPNDVKEKSTYKFYIDGKIYKTGKIYDKDDTLEIGLNKVTCGEHSYKFTYQNSKGKEIVKTGKFTADWGEDLDLYEDHDLVDHYLYQGELYKNSVGFMPDDAKGTLKVIVNNNRTYTFDRKNYDNIVISDLPIGDNVIQFKYSDEKYSTEKTLTDKVRVYGKINAPHVISIMEAPTFSLTLPDDAKGILEAYAGGERFKAPFVNGTATLTLPLMSSDVNIVYVYYSGSDYLVAPFGYDMVTDECEEISVGANVKFPSQMNYGDKEYFIFELPNDARGNLTIKIDGKAQNFEFKNGIARISLSNLIFGEHVISVRYSGDGKYHSMDRSFNIFVNYKKSDISLVKPTEIYQKSTLKLTFKGPKDCTGQVILYAGQETYSAKFSNGKATFSLKTLSSDSQTIYYRYSFSYNSSWHKTTLKLQKRLKIKFLTSDELYYGIEDIYKFKLVKSNGKSIGANKKVKITFYDGSDRKMSSKTLTTDKNGIAKLNIQYLYKNYDPKYTLSHRYFSVKISYGGLTFENKLWYVNPIFITDILKGGYASEDFTFKKSSKVVQLKVYLGNGKKSKSEKVIKSGQVICKLNGKTYKVKTNAKGYALLTINKADLNKLKVSKKYNLVSKYKDAKDVTWIRVAK